MPLRQPWLATLDTLLKKLRLPVEAVATHSGLLELWLRQEPSDRLVVTVSPRSAGLQGYATTQRFVLSYRGSQQLESSTRASLALVAALVQRVESHLPASFEFSEGVFAPELSTTEQFLFLFPFCAIEHSTLASQQATEVLVRATSQCNQRCPFCSAPDHPLPTPTALRQALAQAAETFPGATLSLTGGEPTLRQDFCAQVAEALCLKDLHQLQIQTNALNFAKRLDPAQWTASPRLAFFVSLHATEPALYDRCTGTQGQLPSALEGTRRLLQAGHRVTLNCVVQRENLAHLQAYVRSLPELLPCRDALELHFSTLICPERRPETADYLVRYPVVAQALEEAAALANSLGLPIQSLLSSTHASLPLCLLSDSFRILAPQRPVLESRETGYNDATRPWVKARSCELCVHADHCLGVPSAYAKRFGLEELRPLGVR